MVRSIVSGATHPSVMALFCSNPLSQNFKKVTHIICVSVSGGSRRKRLARNWRKRMEIGKNQWKLLKAPFTPHLRGTQGTQGTQYTRSVWEAPPKKLHPLFGHCPNSDCIPPPPSLKRALWGTLFPGRFELVPFELQFSQHKCPKPSWQEFRPPKNKQMPLWTWTILL